MAKIGLGGLRGVVLAALAASVACAGELPKKFTETIKDKEGKEHKLDMVLIPGGSFTMGSPEDEEDRNKNEGPQHQVKVKPFYLCTTETPFDLYMAYYDETHQDKRDNGRVDAMKEIEDVKAMKLDAITGPTPIYGDVTNGWGAGQRPAIMVAWFNAMICCRWLEKKTGKKYRLPTEAEWEYACRAGSKTPYFCGDDPDDLEDYAWYEENSDGKTQEVAQKKPNPWGLYDMAGNVREWVTDFYGPKAYAENAKNNPIADPRGPAKGQFHVARGGAWDSPPEDLRSAARAFEEDWWAFEDPQEPKSRWWLPKMTFIGFRVALSAEDAK